MAEGKEEEKEEIFLMEYKPPPPLYRLTNINDQDIDNIRNFLIRERDMLHEGYFLQGMSDAPGNLFDMELDGVPMSVADLQPHSRFQSIANRIASTDTSSNIENLGSQQDTFEISGIIRTSAERVAERLGVYDRLLAALNRNSFTDYEKQRMIDLQLKMLQNNPPIQELSFSEL